MGLLNKVKELINPPFLEKTFNDYLEDLVPQNKSYHRYDEGRDILLRTLYNCAGIVNYHNINIRKAKPDDTNKDTKIMGEIFDAIESLEKNDYIPGIILKNIQLHVNKISRGIDYNKIDFSYPDRYIYRRKTIGKMSADIELSRQIPLIFIPPIYKNVLGSHNGAAEHIKKAQQWSKKYLYNNTSQRYELPTYESLKEAINAMKGNQELLLDTGRFKDLIGCTNAYSLNNVAREISDLVHYIGLKDPSLRNLKYIGQWIERIIANIELNKDIKKRMDSQATVPNLSIFTDASHYPAVTNSFKRIDASKLPKRLSLERFLADHEDEIQQDVKNIVTEDKNRIENFFNEADRQNDIFDISIELINYHLEIYAVDKSTPFKILLYKTSFADFIEDSDKYLFYYISIYHALGERYNISSIILKNFYEGDFDDTINKIRKL